MLTLDLSDHTAQLSKKLQSNKSGLHIVGCRIPYLAAVRESEDLDFDRPSEEIRQGSGLFLDHGTYPSRELSQRLYFD